MITRDDLTQKQLKELLHFDPETGVFTWLPRDESFFRDKGHSAAHTASRWNSRCAGRIAGNLRKSKNRRTDYYRIRLFGRNYYAHRLAWLYVYGEFPDQIDHINGDGLDNRISNIRSVSHKTNHRNMPIQRNNSSGVPGVRWCSIHNAWISIIKVNGKTFSLRQTVDFFEAVCARKSAEIFHRFHTNHGRV